MEIEVIQNIESILPIYKIENFKAIQIANTDPPIFDNSQSEDISEYNGFKVKTGAGFGNLETNKQVEQAAILFVVDDYKKRGWSVKSVESEKCGYDLICSKYNVQEHVEVKGIQGDMISFIITGKELMQSKKDESFIILAVTTALSDPTPHRFTGKEFNENFSLMQISSYFASLRKRQSK